MSESVKKTKKKHGASEENKVQKVITVGQNGEGDYDSLSKAAKALRPGNKIQILWGTYYEKDIHINVPDVTVEGGPGVLIVIERGNHALHCNAESITLRNVGLRNFGEDRDCKVVDVLSGSLLMEDCEIRGCYVGIRVGGKSRPLLRRIKVHDCHIGILNTEGSKGIIEDNVIYKNDVGILVKEEPPTIA